MSKSDRKIGVGIVGIGFGQQVHLPAFRSHPSCKVVAICASSHARALRTSARHNIAKSYGDWRELVQDADVDVVSIATPPFIQPEIAIEALSQGKAVFCEKPLALSKTAALDMLAAAERVSLANMVDFELVEIEAFHRAKAVLDRGDIGQLRHIAVSWNVETYVNRMGLHSWKSCAEKGGGVLNSFVSHTFYYLEWFVGRIQRLTASLSSAMGDCEMGDTLAVLCLEFESGIPASLSISSHACLGTGHRVEFYGDAGALVLDNTTTDYAAGWRVQHGTRAANSLQVLHEDDRSSVNGSDGRVVAAACLVERFVEWIATGVRSSPSFVDGLRVQDLLEAARKSHDLGCWIDTP